MFRVEIETDNDAFAEDREEEVARILYALTGQLRSGIGKGDRSYPLRDLNGNTVGQAFFDTPDA